MFVRATNALNSQEANINTAHILFFEPAKNPLHSTVHLRGGVELTVTLSNRSLRHAVKKAQQGQTTTDE